MYKIFVNNKPIFLTDQIIEQTDGFEVSTQNNFSVEEILHKLRNTHIDGYYLYGTDMKQLWQKFTGHFEIVEAAGGLVKKDGQLLLIHRNEIWDLPKGRVEPGETHKEAAIREVNEECGIDRLQIIHKIDTSYHIYFDHKQNKIKKTLWYYMHTDSSETPVPQTIEGITEAKYVPIEKVKELFPNMYENIKETILKFLKAYR